MLKKLGKFIGWQLLKIDWIRTEVQLIRFVAKKRRHHERWARIMHAGLAVRDMVPEKLDPYQTLVIVSDDGAVEEYMNGRVVGQGYVDSVQWGGTKL